MRVSRKSLALSAVLLAGSVTGVTAMGTTPASATAYCDTSLYYQDAYIPGDYDLNPSCVMARGAYGNTVYDLQQSLNQCYGKGLSTDRDFGPKTQAALTQVQSFLRSHGHPDVAADGVYGPHTGNAMLHFGPHGCKQVSFPY
jgi:peptidoglycan hydrolase-like protein with peptidoglycan-binding domain